MAAAEARGFACARCGVAVRICRPCDRGNIYCPACAPVARRERVKRAGAQYQHSAPGRANHRPHTAQRNPESKGKILVLELQLITNLGRKLSRRLRRANRTIDQLEG